MKGGLFDLCSAYKQFGVDQWHAISCKSVSRTRLEAMDYLE